LILCISRQCPEERKELHVNSRSLIQTAHKTGVVLLLSCATLAAAQNISFDKPDPAAAGMSPERLALIHARMKEFVDTGKTAGIVTLVMRHGHLASLDAVGYQDIDKKIPMTPDSIFRVQSITKPITAAGIMTLVDEGRLSLLDPVEKFVPEFHDLKVNNCGTRVGFNCELVPQERPITVLDLMTHMSGLGDGVQERGTQPPNTRKEQVADTTSRSRLLFQPGTAWNYSNFGIAVLGEIIEVVSGKTYPDFMNERIFQPLGMQDSFYNVPAEKQSRVASIYVYADGKLSLLGRRPSETIASPDSGLSTTASDLARFNQMMLNKGVLNGKRVLSAAAIEAMTTSQTGDIKAGYAPGVGQGFGYEVVTSPLGMYRYTSIGSYEKAGVFRTYIWVDPAKDLVGVILQQRNSGGDAADLADEVNVFMAMAAAAIER
jgi:CubicO group peptidase (beta-lactamase class C family)